MNCEQISRERKYRNEFERITGFRPLMITNTDFLKLEEIILLRKILERLEQIERASSTRHKKY